jgi:Mg2+/Co2+ transporter CorB
MEISLLITLLSIVFLLGIAAFFSIAETALTSSSKARLHAQAQAGNKRAALVGKIREKKDRMIGALLLGNNLVNILASALTTSFMIKAFGDSGIFFATALMTVLVVVFTEVLPKTYALHHAETVAKAIAPLVRLVIVVFGPLAAIMASLVRLILRVFGADISKGASKPHEELLRGTIEMHRGPGEETQEQRAMLRSILDLFDVEVSKIMIHRKNVALFNADDPIEKIVETVLNSQYTRLPVWRGDQDNIIGVLHAKLLLKELSESGGDPAKVRLGNVLFDPWFIPDTTNLFDQLQAFRERKEHFAIVVDEYGTFMGIVTLEDILEEIVGEIDDEHDETVPGVRRMSAGTYLVDGTVTIRDLKREFEWNLPDDGYSTIAGLILHEAQVLPEVGQSFSFYGFRFDIVKRTRNQITKIRVSPMSPKPSALHPRFAAGAQG